MPVLPRVLVRATVPGHKRPLVTEEPVISAPIRVPNASRSAHGAPAWTTFAQRYDQPRRLLTRATGTPFWVRSRGLVLIITPGSQKDRIVGYEVVCRCWPHLAAGEPPSQWKHLSDENSSYLSAIFDDVTDLIEAGVVQPPATIPLEIGLEIGLRDEQIHDLKETVARQVDEIQALKLAGTRADDAVSRMEAAVAEGARLERELEDAQRDRARLEREVEDARREMAEVRAEAEATRDGAIGHLAPVSAGQPLEVVFDVAGLRLSSRGFVDEAVAPPLEDSAKRVFHDPDGAVLSCRRALETAIALLWGRATGSIPGLAPRRASDQLYDLRDHPLLPMPDWHMAKNLYGRASAIVHEGGGTTEAALWLWLGTWQFARLVRGAEDGTSSD